MAQPVRQPSLRAGQSMDWTSVAAWFSLPVQTGPGAHPASYAMSNESFPGVMRPSCSADHLNPFSAKVKERVELFLYSPSVPSWQDIRWNSPFRFSCKTTRNSPIPSILKSNIKAIWSINHGSWNKLYALHSWSCLEEGYCYSQRY